MKCWSQKQWVIPAIAAASLVLSLAGATGAIASKLPQPRSGVLSPQNPVAQLDPNLVNITAMSEPQTGNTPKYPLSPNDPAAQLDPSLFNVPAVPESDANSAPPSDNNQSDVREISRDIGTGSTRVGDRKSETSSNASTRVSSPNLGADSNVTPEPR